MRVRNSLLFVMAVLSMLMLSTAAEAATYRPSPGSSITTLILRSAPSTAHHGEEIKVSGELRDAMTGEGIVDAEVKVIDNRPLAQEVLVTTKTRKYGLFVAVFNATLADPDRTGALHIIAKFEGSESHLPSVSREHTVTVKLAPLDVRFLYLKTQYSQGERAEVIFTVTSGNTMLEPEIMRTSFDGSPVAVKSYGTGNYVYETPPLTKGWHQFFVSVSKPGYGTLSRIISIKAG